MKFYKVETDDVGPFIVRVLDSEAKAWEDEQRYLADAGVPGLSIQEYEIYHPGDLSDELAPRDD